MSAVAVRSKPFFRSTLPEDIQELALTMREEDREEIFHSSRADPATALARGAAYTDELFTIEREGRVAAIFGVVGTKGTSGSPWMLGSPDLKHCKSLLREGRKLLDSYVDTYTHLSNSVWSKNRVHVEWIKWLGFIFEGSDIRNGQTFLHFHRSKHV